jgi:hypothetical protein
MNHSTASIVYAPYTPEDDLFPPTPYVPTPEALRIAQEQLDSVEPIDLEEREEEGGQE